MLALLLTACTSGPAPADPARLLGGLGMGVIPRAEVAPIEGTPAPYPGYTVRPVSLQVYEDFRVSAAFWLPDGPGPFPAVLMAHGHFGEGKSSGEAQGPAHALAQAGYAVLAVDTPGVEEGDLPGRRIHFAEGAHGRALLASAGSSAMAVQLDGLQAGLDWLDARPDVSEIAVTGASGGSVQAFYLLFVDPRPIGAVLASPVPMPREARAGGCACDGVPGWPGPDPGLYAAAPKPTLWLSELDQPAFSGLPRSADFKVVPGPHGYEPAMIDAALDWLNDRMDGGEWSGELPHTPPETLRSSALGAATFATLLHPARPPTWTPAPDFTAPYTVNCRGNGPKVLLAGGEEADALALSAGGFSVCTFSLREDEVALDEGLITRSPTIDRVVGAMATATRREGAVGVYAVRAWGVAAGALPDGSPFVVRQPLGGPEQVDEARDPAWVHAPGLWWGGATLHAALASGDDPAALVAALRATQQPAAPDLPKEPAKHL